MIHLLLKRSSLFVLAACLFTASVAHAHPTHDGDEPAIDRQVEIATPLQKVAFLLSAIHELPSKEAFEAIPGARELIEKIALNHQSIQQHRAVAALGYYADAGVLQTWKYLLNDPKTREGIRHEILIQVGEHFKNDQGVALLKPYLNHPDLQFRISAVYALSAIKSEGAKQAMRERYLIERDSFVRETMEKYGELAKE